MNKFNIFNIQFMKQSQEKLQQYLHQKQKSMNQSLSQSPLYQNLMKLTHHQRQASNLHIQDIKSKSNRSFNFTNSFINKHARSPTYNSNCNSNVNLYKGIQKVVKREQKNNSGSKQRHKSTKSVNPERNSQEKQGKTTKCTSFAINLKNNQKINKDNKNIHKKQQSMTTFEKLLQQKMLQQKQLYLQSCNNCNMTLNNSYNNQSTINLNKQRFGNLCHNDDKTINKDDKNNILLQKISKAMSQSAPLSKLFALFPVLDWFSEANLEFSSGIDKIKHSLKSIEENMNKNHLEQLNILNQTVQEYKENAETLLKQNQLLQNQLEMQISCNDKLEIQLSQQVKKVTEVKDDRNDEICQIKQTLEQNEQKLEQMQEKEAKMIKLLMAVKKRGIDIDKIYNKDVLNEELEQSSSEMQIKSDIKISQPALILDSEGIPFELSIQRAIIAEGNEADNSVVDTSQESFYVQPFKHNISEIQNVQNQTITQTQNSEIRMLL